MTGAELDTEYHDRWAQGNWACGFHSQDENHVECLRPRRHSGDHAGVLGMDPDVNDWFRWPAI